MTIVKSGRGKDQWLKVEVVNGNKLVISIGVDVLAFAANAHFDEEHLNATEGRENQADWVVTYPAGFAEDVCAELLREDEAGEHMLGRLLDEAFDLAANRGSLHMGDRVENSGVTE